VASIQFALPVVAFLLWTKHWPVTDLKIADRGGRKIIVENGERHPSGSTAPVAPPKRKGWKRLTCGRDEYKVAKVKAAGRLLENKDPVTEMVRKFAERAESLEHRSLVKDAVNVCGRSGRQ